MAHGIRPSISPQATGMKWWVCWSTGRRRSILARRGAADPGARRLGTGAEEALSGREGMEVEEWVREEITLALHV